MNRTTTHARWRALPAHLVAKLFGVLIKVEGMPFGSNRTRLASPPHREDVAGGQFPASVKAHIGQAVEAQMKSMERLAALRRLGQAAGDVPVAPKWPSLKTVNRSRRIRI